MRCPNLKELPQPPKGKTGWPWTEESPQLPDTMSDGKAWPKISIVTPNYNCAQFIEETIRSVLLQGYPNLEYIVIDGGSLDKSVEIIKRYEKWLTYWVSQPDRGQSDAINNGFRKSTGDFLAWLNSDDIYEKNALYKIAKEFIVHSEADVISGMCRMRSGKKDDVIVGPSHLRTYEDFLRLNNSLTIDNFGTQSATFFSRRAYELAGGLPEDLYYVLDVALWMRMARRGCNFCSINEVLARCLLHKKRKTADYFSTMQEHCRLAWNYLRQDWDMFKDKAPLIADDIFRAVEKIQVDLKEQANKFNIIRNSIFYRIGRCFYKIMF